MPLFQSRKTANAKAFVNAIAEKLTKRYPPEVDTNPAKRVSANRLTRILEETYAEARAFQQENKLGVLGKARLGTDFKWALKERGYSAPFIEVATEGLMVMITRGDATSPESDTSR